MTTASAGYDATQAIAAHIYTIDDGEFIVVTISPDSSNEFFNIVGPNFSYVVPVN